MSIYRASRFSCIPNEPNENDFWITMATQYIRTRKTSTVARSVDFTTEDLAIEMKVLDYPAPPDSRLVGLAIQRAQREGLIKSTGTKRPTRARPGVRP